MQQPNPLNISSRQAVNESLPVMSNTKLAKRLINKYFAKDSSYRELAPMFEYMLENEQIFEWDQELFETNGIDYQIAILTAAIPFELTEAINFLQRFFNDDPLAGYTICKEDYLQWFETSNCKDFLCLTALLFEQRILFTNSFSASLVNEFNYQQVSLTLDVDNLTPIQSRMLNTWRRLAIENSCIGVMLFKEREFGYQLADRILAQAMIIAGFKS